MKPQKVIGLAEIILALALLAGCGKSQRRPELTLADLETTNGPVSATLTRFVPRTGSKVRLDGTSNIHDWQVESSLIGGYLEVGPNFPVGPGQAIKPGRIEAHAEPFVFVRSLKSIEKDGKPYSDAMDSIMCEKLKAQDDPKARITFHLTELTSQPSAGGTNDGAYLFEAKGCLVVAGVTNQISMPVRVLPLGDQKLKISGRTAVKMTVFGIQPPSPKLTFGLIKTGDEVKLGFEWMVGQRPASATK